MRSPAIPIHLRILNVLSLPLTVSAVAALDGEELVSGTNGRSGELRSARPNDAAGHGGVRPDRHLRVVLDSALCHLCGMSRLAHPSYGHAGPGTGNAAARCLASLTSSSMATADAGLCSLSQGRSKPNCSHTTRKYPVCQVPVSVRWSDVVRTHPK
jgi:hypothetical protein